MQLALADTDRRVAENRAVAPSFLLACLLWHDVLSYGDVAGAFARADGGTSTGVVAKWNSQTAAAAAALDGLRNSAERVVLIAGGIALLAVVRKLFGYAHISQRHAVRFNTFCREFLNPFLNFHRPCLFATDIPDPKKPGRIKRVYRPRDAMTPLDKLASLPEAHKYLRAGITLQHLQQLARALSDVQAAEELNAARAALFRRVPTRA